MKKALLRLLTVLLLALLLCACGAEPERESAAAPIPAPETPAPVNEGPDPAGPELEEPKEEETAMLKLKIGETAVAVDWEDNASVQALGELCRTEPLTIDMSMYGGFEQVGPIGQRLPRDDTQTTTGSGDIVLYSGNQIVVFYGSNSWAYTRLGHISDQGPAEMAALLGKGDVSITLYWED